MCLHWDHICYKICMITVLHACAVLHFICINIGIQSEFDEADNCLFLCMYVCIYALGIQRVN